jgi:hypothetical protein
MAGFRVQMGLQPRRGARWKTQKDLLPSPADSMCSDTNGDSRLRVHGKSHGTELRESRIDVERVPKNDDDCGWDMVLKEQGA